jgi:hypothetical protein
MADAPRSEESKEERKKIMTNIHISPQLHENARGGMD